MGPNQATIIFILSVLHCVKILENMARTKSIKETHPASTILLLIPLALLQWKLAQHKFVDFAAKQKKGNEIS